MKWGSIKRERRAWSKSKLAFESRKQRTSVTQSKVQLAFEKRHFVRLNCCNDQYTLNSATCHAKNYLKQIKNVDNVKWLLWSQLSNIPWSWRHIWIVSSWKHLNIPIVHDEKTFKTFVSINKIQTIQEFFHSGLFSTNDWCIQSHHFLSFFFIRQRRWQSYLARSFLQKRNHYLNQKTFYWNIKSFFN